MAMTHPLLLLLDDKPRDSIPLNQHKKEKQQTKPGMSRSLV
jgi:hypothetical protein